MRFTALVRYRKSYLIFSGGKDSCFNIIKCLDQGHEIVSLSNLYPPAQGLKLNHVLDEIDSYMYQSIGHEGIEMIGHATRLPLHRQCITGKPLETTLDYQHKYMDDEVENLYTLLKSVKSQEMIEGVSCGAIWSEYQKNRLEHVCERLDLEPLCYLWRREQSQLLAEMLEANQNNCATETVPSFHVIIIKVACLGLNPYTDLGLTLDQLQPKLMDCLTKYGINVCGEGGEYETFVLNCSLHNLYKRPLKVSHAQTFLIQDHDNKPVQICANLTNVGQNFTNNSVIINNNDRAISLLAPVGYLKMDHIEMG